MNETGEGKWNPYRGNKEGGLFGGQMKSYSSFHNWFLDFNLINSNYFFNFSKTESRFHRMISGLFFVNLIFGLNWASSNKICSFFSLMELLVPSKVYSLYVFLERQVEEERVRLSKLSRNELLSWRIPSFISSWKSFSSFWFWLSEFIWL